MKYGEQLLDFRAKHNLSQEKMAKILGVSKYMIFRYENEISRPHPKNLIRFENKMKEWETEK